MPALKPQISQAANSPKPDDFFNPLAIYGRMSGPPDIPFVRMNGLGNEIVVMDFRGSAKVLQAEDARAVAAAPRSGFDQLMVLHDPRTPGTSAFVRIYNTDGSESSACGNGTRCIAWLEAQKTGRSALQFETKAGILQTNIVDIGHITVDMGEPHFAWNEIPLSEPFHDTRGIELQIGPIDAPILHSPSVVNVGNPHAIFWVDDSPENYDLGRFGPMLEHHPLFPERANISLAQVISPEAIRARTWERGAGLTRACGTAACAVAVSAARKRMTGRKVTVNVPGGPLIIEWTSDNRILKTGPVEVEYEDRVSLTGHPAAAL
jgi:diaminopimelate epimerase